jgi:transcription elongation factor GreA
MDKIPISREGLEKLRAELKKLVHVERPQNIRAIEEARAHGDLSENAEYHAAKERQSFIGAKITELESVVNRCEVLNPDEGPTDRVVFGRTVLLYNVSNDEEVSYRLLGPYDSDPSCGCISVRSPLGQALLGREKGDSVTVQTPKGPQEFEILEIS